MKTQTTVVAVYRNLSDAQAAAAELKANGFSGRDIYIHSGESGATDPSHTSEHVQYSHHEGGITGWFKSLFGSGERTPEQRDYENAFSSGNAILGVETTDEGAERAADIMNRYSPLNVHEEAGGAEPSTAAGTSLGTRGGVGSPPPRATPASSSPPEYGAVSAGSERGRTQRRPVVRGGVWVYSRAVETDVEEDRPPL